KVVVRPERNGYLYILDRVTGEVLFAEPYGEVNSILDVNLKTGRPTMNPDKIPRTGIVVRDICPNASGAKDWNPSAYSPQTGLLYIPHQNICEEFEATQANYISGTPFLGANLIMMAGPGGHRGLVTAWDPVAGKKVWQISE